MKSLFHISFFSLFFFLSSSPKVFAQQLRYVAGYCNRVEATTDFVAASRYNTYVGNNYVNCPPNGTRKVSSRLISDSYIFQLQKLVNNQWQNQGSAVYKESASTIYRDLLYGSTYRVKITAATATTESVYNQFNACNSFPIGFAQGPSVIQYTNALEIQPYNGLTNSDLNGVLQSSFNFGGNGTSFSQRRKYCVQNVQSDITYDISGTHGPDHWQINLERLSPSDAWAPGVSHDYEPASIVGSVNVFEQGWTSVFGSGSIWPGIYRVDILGYQDCDNAPWPTHSDYFEIVATGMSPCRINNQEVDGDIVVYPNPITSGYLQFYTIGEGMERLEFTIFNMNGQVVLEGLTHDGTGELDVAKLETGIYAVTFRSKTETFTKRISVIKQ